MCMVRISLTLPLPVSLSLPLSFPLSLSPHSLSQSPLMLRLVVYIC